MFVFSVIGKVIYDNLREMATVEGVNRITDNFFFLYILKSNS